MNDKKKNIHVSISVENFAFLFWLKQSSQNVSNYSTTINFLLGKYKEEYFKYGGMTDEEKEAVKNLEKLTNSTIIDSKDIAELNHKFNQEIQFFNLDRALMSSKKRDTMRYLLDIYDDEAKQKKEAKK
jgi:hypothetical protein